MLQSQVSTKFKQKTKLLQQFNNALINKFGSSLARQSASWRWDKQHKINLDTAIDMCERNAPIHAIGLTLKHQDAR